MSEKDLMLTEKNLIQHNINHPKLSFDERMKLWTESVLERWRIMDKENKKNNDNKE